MLRRKLHETVN